MKIIIENDQGERFEVLPNACGETCGLFLHGVCDCSFAHLTQPCDQMLDAIDAVTLTGYGFRRVLKGGSK